MLDPYTKARYHASLQTLCGITMPTVAEENANPTDADQRYRAATTKLLELRRGAQYEMLHKDNRLYGFRRNLLGLKPLAEGLLLVVIAVPIIMRWHALGALPQTFGGFMVDADQRPALYASTAANLLYLLVWWFVVTREFVRQGANDYALALFRTLDG